MRFARGTDTRVSTVPLKICTDLPVRSSDFCVLSGDMGAAQVREHCRCFGFLETSALACEDYIHPIVC